MKKITFTFTLFFFFHNWNLPAQQDLDLSILTLPQELTKNANAVVRKQQRIIDVNSVNQMTIKNTSVVTVLNKKGHQRLITSVGYDNHTRISRLEGRIYNSLGKETKKYRKNDFIDVSAVDGVSLYTDSRVKYIDFTPVSYPYTFVFSYELKTTSTANIPSWIPVNQYYVGVQENEYVINYPPELGFQKKEKNFEGFPIEDNSVTGKIHYKVTNILPVKYESLAPSLIDSSPNALLSLSHLTTDGVEGSYRNWNEFGRWMHQSLLLGQDILDGATKQKVLELTANAETVAEKAKIIYKYMQDRTRYISVQVGIGGIQPIAANQVDRVGYGDCKGLTNYTKALLNVVGVKSYYVHVEAGTDDNISLENDFASLAQGNHVILNIPNGNNDIWLECTSQTSPFGFLGDFTDDRDVLVITPEGGVIKRTPAYLNEDNLQITKATIELNPEGSLNADVDISSEGIRYDARYMLEKETPLEQKKYYKSGVWSYNNNLEVLSIAFDNNKDSVIFRESLEVSIADYATLSGSDYLLKVNAFNRNTFVPKRYRERKMPLKILRGYKDVSEYNYKIPEGYSIGELPEPKIIETKFGMYKVVFQKLDDTTFTYAKTMLIKAGEYPKEEYKNYRRFRKLIAKYENIRILLTKKT